MLVLVAFAIGCASHEWRAPAPMAGNDPDNVRLERKILATSRGKFGVVTISNPLAYTASITLTKAHCDVIAAKETFPIYFRLSPHSSVSFIFSFPQEALRSLTVRKDPFSVEYAVSVSSEGDDYYDTPYAEGDEQLSLVYSVKGKEPMPVFLTYEPTHSTSRVLEVRVVGVYPDKRLGEPLQFTIRAGERKQIPKVNTRQEIEVKYLCRVLPDGQLKRGQIGLRLRY